MALVCNRDKRGGGQSRTSWFMNEGHVSMFTLSDERQGRRRKIISLYLLDLWSELGSYRNPGFDLPICLALAYTDFYQNDILLKIISLTLYTSIETLPESRYIHMSI